MQSPSPLGREVIALMSAKMDELAANAEVEADLLRQAAELVKSGKFIEHFEELRKAAKLHDKRKEGCEELNDLFDTLEIIDPPFYQSIRTTSIEKQVSGLSVEEAKQSLAVHSFQCQDGANCDVHKALLRKIKNAGG